MSETVFTCPNCGRNLPYFPKPSVLNIGGCLCPACAALPVTIEELPTSEFNQAMLQGQVDRLERERDRLRAEVDNLREGILAARGIIQEIGDAQDNHHRAAVWLAQRGWGKLPRDKAQAP